MSSSSATKTIMRQWKMRSERAELRVRIWPSAGTRRSIRPTVSWPASLEQSVERGYGRASRTIKAEAANVPELRETRDPVGRATGQDPGLGSAICRSCGDAPTTEAKDRKRMLRLLIADITVERLGCLRVRW